MIESDAAAVLLQFRTHKVIYRRYAGLFFSMCVDITDNELAYLECIHLFVEILDHFFSNVCELDLVFNFHKVYLILDEFILAGELQETSKKARVTLQNYYQYLHVDDPGWHLGWAWSSTEVIWSVTGAFATKQGNCSGFKDQIPHSCKKDPVIADLMPGDPAENQTANCCRGGLLSALAIDPTNSFSSFEVVVGNLGGNSSGHMPQNLTLMAPGPGYTCSTFLDYPPTSFPSIGGRREVQVFNYSKLENIVRCTDHMCSIRVHWHLKNNYRDHWRVKLTVSNYNYGKNFSNWNLLVHHPAFSVNFTAYSFNSTMLPTVGFADEVALFWGIDYYNDDLLQANKEHEGSVSTEILILKDPKSFTLSNGWAFPRRIYFNGENCEMPLPDVFPMLPNVSSHHFPIYYTNILLIALYLAFHVLAW
ncbi:hypothetical protein Scep_000390 [Stephania cephalantha]|uniref:COBRA C-terminal domain-containing protein n=1 Tax=Stephania cephalantha TaxID=152367 RepID=A0AAP0L9P8_9MAGN